MSLSELTARVRTVWESLAGGPGGFGPVVRVAVSSGSLLTAARARGRGLGAVASSAAVTHALAAGKLPQWRARVEASQRIARGLGFHELGAQVGFRLTTD
jgi:hypothetical protein